MKNKIFMLLSVFFLAGGSLLTLAEEITVDDQDFDLGNGVVTGEWRKDEKTLTIIGVGKIDASAWGRLKNDLKLTTDDAENVKIFFTRDVQFPDDASTFFYKVKSADIIFDPAMDTSNVTNMRAMFKHALNFNGDISNWDTSNVTTMQDMFQCEKTGGCRFNGDISNWNTSRVETMRSMFQFATSFNGDLSNWNTSNVADMSYMFAYATGFEGKGVWEWNVGKVTTVKQMFYDAKEFNTNLSK